MKKIFIVLPILLSSLTIYSIQGAADNCMRCTSKTAGSALLCEGDSTFDAITKCGEPDFSEETGTETSGFVVSKSRWGTMGGHWSTFSKKKKKSSSFLEVTEKVEKWYYNCGYGQFNKILTFRGGRLVAVESSPDRGSGGQRCW